MSQIARNFSATFCATSATSLAQLLDFLSATFWGGTKIWRVEWPGLFQEATLSSKT